MRGLVLAVWAILASFPVLAQPALLNTAALPEGVRGQYGAFLLGHLPRAFALSKDGKMGWYAGADTLEVARQRALKSCQDKGGTACALYAENLSVVGKPEALAVPPAVMLFGEAGRPLTLFGGAGWGFEYDARYFYWGPSRAKGVYVFSHGKNPNDVDARGFQAHPFVRYFNDRGFDVVMFAREPTADDRDKAAGWLRDGLKRVRGLGYKMVIAGGQSRGAWNSLQSLDTAGLAEAVIAVSAASNGVNAGAQASLGQAEVYRIFSAANAPQARVAVVQFANDDYEHNPDKRFSMVDDLLKPKVAALLKINQPAGVSGHGGGYAMKFATDYAGCLYRFATEAVPPGAC